MFRRVFMLLLACSLAAPAWAQRLSALAPVPNWGELEPYQETMTREEFQHLLDTVYAPGGAAREVVEVKAEGALIKTRLQPAHTYLLRFAGQAKERKPAPSRMWRPAATLPPASSERPLAGVRIALDPGHLGGTWARMEERYFQIGESKPVMEGDLTLRVAGLLADRLQALGAEVRLVRYSNDPTTSARPASLQVQAAEQLKTPGAAPVQDPQREAELLFYRISEIRERARVVNEQLKPDLTVCLHFNAEAWGDPQRPEFVPRNHFHTLINGCYSAAELQNDDLRLEMLLHLLGGYLLEEQAASEAVVQSFVQATRMPAYTYTTNNAVRIGTSGYIWGRNLLANRLYRTPVIYLEPYVMNSELIWMRVQAGDYEGELLLGGERRKSIFREYADAVATGLAEYYRKARPAAAP